MVLFLLACSLQSNIVPLDIDAPLDIPAPASKSQVSPEPLVMIVDMSVTPVQAKKVLRESLS
jgi:hypothetical protein